MKRSEVVPQEVCEFGCGIARFLLFPAQGFGGGLRRDGFGCWRTNGRKNAPAQNRRDGKPPPLLKSLPVALTSGLEWTQECVRMELRCLRNYGRRERCGHDIIRAL